MNSLGHKSGSSRSHTSGTLASDPSARSWSHRTLGYAERREEIIASIISVAVGGERKTHIMYRVNLSHSQLQRYLTLLEISGLVRVIKDQSGKASIYEATERGMMFLRDYGRLESYFKRKDPMTNSNISSSLDQI